jgi:hypothetical protein
MGLVLPQDGSPNLEKLESFKADEALGYFFGLKHLVRRPAALDYDVMLRSKAEV